MSETSIQNPAEAPQTPGPGRPRPVWAAAVSDALSPLLVPTYAVAMSMWLTPLKVIPEGARFKVTAIVAALTALLPLLAIVALMRMGRVSDRSISDRRQRHWPYLITVICYLGTAYCLMRFGLMWVSVFFFGATVATLVCGLINFFWKISAHTTALGGLTGLTAWYALTGLTTVNPLVLLTIVLLLSGLTGTSRLLLNRHTAGQVFAGFGVGFACVLTALFLLN